MAFEFKRGALLLMAILGQTGCGAFPGQRPDASAHFEAAEVAALAQAACDGDAAEVAERVAAGVPVSATGKADITPLGFAATCGSPEGVRALLQAGADPNYRHQGKMTTTWVAAGFDQPEALAALLDAGGDMHAADNRGDTVLMRAFALGGLTLEGNAWGNYEMLLARGVNLNQAGDMGYGIADIATAMGRFDKIAELLERGFTYDLLSSAWATENRAVSPDQQPHVERVKVLLKARGVKWPIPVPLNDENRNAYMRAHPEYAEKHPESWPIDHGKPE